MPGEMTGHYGEAVTEAAEACARMILLPDQVDVWRGLEFHRRYGHDGVGRFDGKFFRRVVRIGGERSSPFAYRGMVRE